MNKLVLLIVVAVLLVILVVVVVKVKKVDVPQSIWKFLGFIAVLGIYFFGLYKLKQKYDSKGSWNR